MIVFFARGAILRGQMSAALFDKRGLFQTVWLERDVSTRDGPMTADPFKYEHRCIFMTSL